MAKIAVIYYSTYGHVKAMALKEAEGLKAAGADVSVFQIPETLPQEVLEKMHAPPKDADIPEITVDDLPNFDGFLFGLSTRFGSYPAQFKAFWDQTGGLWASCALHGKYVGVFVSTGSPNSGQETSVRNTLSNFVHLGLIYVPFGYKNAFADLTNLSEIHGGSPWGAGCYAGTDGSRMPSDLELGMAVAQGKAFGAVVSKATSQRSSNASSAAQSTAVAPTPENEKATAPDPSAAAAATAATAATTATDARAKQQSTNTAPPKKESSKFCGICSIM